MFIAAGGGHASYLAAETAASLEKEAEEAAQESDQQFEPKTF